MRRRGASSVGVALLLMASRVRAQPATTTTTTAPIAAPDDADEARYRQAQQLRASDPEGALAIYRELHERTHTPRASAQLGLLLAQLGRWLPAEEQLVAALAIQGDAWVEPRREALTTNLATIRGHLTDVTVTSNVEGARLRVQGADAGVLPLQRPVRAVRGTLVVELEADGYDPVRQSLDADAATTRTDLTLVRMAPPRGPDATPVAIVAPPDGRLQRALGITSLGLGAVGLGLGVAGLVLRNAQVDAFTQRGCWLDNDRADGGGECSTAYDEGNTMQSLATAGFVAGVVFTAAGTVLLLTLPSATATRRALACGPTLQGAGVTCAGSF